MIVAVVGMAMIVTVIMIVVMLMIVIMVVIVLAMLMIVLFVRMPMIMNQRRRGFGLARRFPQDDLPTQLAMEPLAGQGIEHQAASLSHRVQCGGEAEATRSRISVGDLIQLAAACKVAPEHLFRRVLHW